MSTRNLVAGLAALDRKPGVLVSGSAVGFYGSRGDEVLDEQSPAGTGFLAETCTAWEAEAKKAQSIGIRTVLARTGIVLSRDGGALAKMVQPFKLGLGGKLGSGRQWFPWIHIEDMVGILRFLLSNGSVAGPMNATAPNPVTNADFTRELARALHRPAFLPVPEAGLRALMGEMAEALLSSQRALPKAIISAGYEFLYRDLPSALANLLEPGRPGL
jgi:uncharacterized protein (TIGR01777 family)